MPHGYYNLQGAFVETDTLEEATASWREERGYDPVGVFDMGDHIVDTRQQQPSTPSAAPPVVPQTTPSAGQPTYDVQGIQSLTTETSAERNARLQAAFNEASTSAPTTPQPASTFYDVQSIQGTPQQPQAPSGATPTEQAAAQGGGVLTHIDPYFADIGSGTQYIYSQWPYSAGGGMTPTEARYGQTDSEGNYAGYGPTIAQWSESPGALAEMAQGRTPVAPALAAADTVRSLLENFGVRPDFITPFVQQALGLTAADMGPDGLGMVQDLYGQWIALDYGDESLVDGGSYGSGGGSGYGGGYSGSRSYSSPANFRSGYTSGLISWRIGF